MKKYLSVKNNYKIRKILLCISILIILYGCISVNPIPDPAEIIFATIAPPEKFKGKVDFVGLQWYLIPYLYNSKRPLKYNLVKNFDGDYSKLNPHFFTIMSLNEEQSILFLFVKSLHPQLRLKIHNYIRESFFWGISTGYEQTFFKFYNEHIPIIDDWNINIVNTGGPGRMDDDCLSFLKKSSKADYFFIAAIRPLEVRSSGEKNISFTMKIALLTVLYNNQGEKIYSKIYEDELEGIKDPKKDRPYYTCSEKLIKTYAEQINKDLFFILTADNAENPTLEDLYQEMITKKKWKK